MGNTSGSAVDWAEEIAAAIVFYQRNGLDWLPVVPVLGVPFHRRV